MNYQYKVVNFPCKVPKGFHMERKIDEIKVEEETNKLAKEGWRLVKTTPIHSGYGHTQSLVLFFEKEI